MAYRTSPEHLQALVDTLMRSAPSRGQRVIATNNDIALNGQHYSFDQGAIDFQNAQPGSSGSPAYYTIGVRT